MECLSSNKEILLKVKTSELSENYFGAKSVPSRSELFGHSWGKKEFKKSLWRQSFLPQRLFTMLQAVCFVKIYYFSALRNKHHTEEKQMKNNDKTLFPTLRRCRKPCAGAGNLTSRANFMVEVITEALYCFSRIPRAFRPARWTPAPRRCEPSAKGTYKFSTDRVRRLS